MIHRTKIDSSRIREIYDQLSPRYDRREAFLDLLVLRGQRKRLFSEAHGRVLEVGIGTGKNLRYYPSDCKITGIDLSTGMLQIAENRAKKLNLQIQLMQMDAHEMQFPDRTFDTVTSSLTLCTFVDPIQALSEMARIVRPNGMILLLEHGRSAHPLINRWLDWLTPHFVKNHGCHLNRNVAALAQAANLRLLHTRRMFFGLIYAIQCKPHKTAPPLKNTQI